MKKWTPLIIKYLSGFMIGGVMSCLVMSNYGFSAAQTSAERYKILCDAFTVPGVLILAVGALVWLSAQGATDSITYLIGGIFKRLIPIGRWKEERFEKYYDFVERKRAKRPKGYGFIFVIGGVFMAIAIVFMILFYRVY